MSDHKEHDPTTDDSQLFQSNCIDKEERPSRFSDFKDPVCEMDVDVDADSDLTMEEEEPDLLIASLHFTNGLSQDTTEIKVFAGQEVRVGREDDPSACQFIIADFRVSKKHFRVYSIIYEQTNLDEIQPLIYCEDLESTNGTYVNNECIGKTGFERRGYLLTDGDVIEIKPYWKYQFRQIHKPSKNNDDPDQIALGDLQYFNNRYDVTARLLGAGQYGKVYLAKELATSRQLACKIINLEQAQEEAMNFVGTWSERRHRAREERDKLLREVTVLAQLSHPHIMDLKKAFCSNKFICMFTELAPAGDLFSYCDAHGGKLSDVEGRIICRQIALALEHLHEKQIAHRDIKKENILIMQMYEFGCRIVLTDFGFAHHLDPKTRRMMSKVGTTGYAAPEVEAADQTSIGYTLAVDMYSLGVLTLNILHGDSLLPRDIYSQQSQGNVDNFVGGTEIKSLTVRAKKFLRGLLDPDPTKRMNVHQALEHSWFNKPQGEATAIEEAIKRITRYWKPRDNSDGVIEDHPDKVALRKEQSLNPGEKSRRKIPDINPYPFIGLNNRLHPRPQSSREQVLDDLKEKDSFFVTESADESHKSRKIHSCRQLARIRSVPGADLFGTNLGKSVLDGGGGEDYVDGSSLVSTSMDEYRLQATFEASNEVSVKSMFSNDLWSDQAHREPRRMYEAQLLRLRPSPDEQGIRADLVKKISRHSDSRAYGETVRTMMAMQNLD